MDICPITYAEIESWERKTKTTLLNETVEMIIDMDDAFMAALADEQEIKRSEPPPKKGKSNKWTSRN